MSMSVTCQNFEGNELIFSEIYNFTPFPGPFSNENDHCGVIGGATGGVNYLCTG